MNLIHCILLATFCYLDYAEGMEVKIFIGLKSSQLTNEEEIVFKKVTHEGKEFSGYFAEKNMLSLEEVIAIAQKIVPDPYQVTLFPILLFG